MKKHRISVLSKALLLFTALLFIGALFVPMWQIQLEAPQYPEGLVLQLYANKIGGDVDIINGLNHYIGMATIQNEMFPEFAIMRYAIGLLMGWGLVAALVGRRGGLFTWLMVLGAFVLWAMWDMYSWGYKYGHDLDPHAAIKVEGMAYQPPLFGHKKLLNFDAWSLPDTGGWVLFGAITIACTVWLVEWRRGHRDQRRSTSARSSAPPYNTIAATVFATLLHGCASEGPPNIAFGQVECSYCRMNVMDERFGAAIVTLQGRTYAFDSPECMVHQVADGRIAEAQVRGWWVCDHAHPGTFIDATQASYQQANTLRSPMNGNVAAFRTAAERDHAAREHVGASLDWAGARALLTTH